MRVDPHTDIVTREVLVTVPEPHTQLQISPVYLMDVADHPCPPAVREGAANENGFLAQVVGKPGILLGSDVDAGYMLAKQLTDMSGTETAGVVLDAREPIIPTSRADSACTRITSCA